jgi:peptide methionine sulfoxide reductase msrA/msrB
MIARGWIVLPAVAVVAAAVVAVGQRRDAPPQPQPRNETMQTRPLTPEESRVIEHKGTERPFSGRYWNHHAAGTYDCRRCGAPLFASDAKFDSGTGWPSFDQALPGAVREVRDADGTRTEIVCAACGGHLGHVFRGEGFTARGTRHCVNSLSLDFRPDADGTATAGPAVAAGATASAGTCAPGGEAPAPASGPAYAYFAGGCFWGVEYWFEKMDGVLSAVSGYMGGRVDRPTYRQVCSGTTGHIETVRVAYDPARVTYEALARRFFEIHDPTQVDRQGPDVGEQYRSVVFHVDEAQRQVAQRLMQALVARGFEVATRLEPAATFWEAEDYHQDYYEHKGSEPYCHMPVRRFGD